LLSVVNMLHINIIFFLESTYVSIDYMLNLSNITSKFHTITIFFMVGLETIINK